MKRTRSGKIRTPITLFPASTDSDASAVKRKRLLEVEKPKKAAKRRLQSRTTQLGQKDGNGNKPSQTKESTMGFSGAPENNGNVWYPELGVKLHSHMHDEQQSLKIGSPNINDQKEVSKLGISQPKSVQMAVTEKKLRPERIQTNVPWPIVGHDSLASARSAAMDISAITPGIPLAASSSSGYGGQPNESIKGRKADSVHSRPRRLVATSDNTIPRRDAKIGTFPPVLLLPSQELFNLPLLIPGWKATGYFYTPEVGKKD